MQLPVPCILKGEPATSSVFMKRNPAIWALTSLIFLPFVWLIWTAPQEMTLRSLGFALGALVTAVAMVVFAWKAQRAGRLVPHRCLTCDRPIRLIVPGELRPPSGSSAQVHQRWRCTYCGRLI